MTNHFWKVINRGLWVLLLGMTLSTPVICGVYSDLSVNGNSVPNTGIRIYYSPLKTAANPDCTISFVPSEPLILTFSLENTKGQTAFQPFFTVSLHIADPAEVTENQIPFYPAKPVSLVWHGGSDMQNRSADNALPDGEYLMTFAAVDNALNQATANHAVLVIDTQKPDIQIQSIPSKISLVTQKGFIPIQLALKDNASLTKLTMILTTSQNAILAQKEYPLPEGSPAVSWSGNLEDVIPDVIRDQLTRQEGWYQIQLILEDSAGNITESSSPLLIDNTPPILNNVVLSLATINCEAVQTGTAKLSFNTNDNFGTGNITIMIRTSSGPNQIEQVFPYSPSVNIPLTEDLLAIKTGKLNLQLIVSDGVNDTIRNFPLTVDVVAPAILEQGIANPVQSPVLTNPFSADFRFSEPISKAHIIVSNADSTVITENVWQNTAQGLESIHFENIKLPSEGLYTVVLYAKDMLDNVSDPWVQTIAMDQTPPDLIASLNAVWISDIQTQKVMMIASDNYCPTMSLKIDYLYQGKWLTSDTISLQNHIPTAYMIDASRFPADLSGTIEYRTALTDWGNNQTVTSGIIILDRHPPVITHPDMIITSQNITLSGTVTDPEGGLSKTNIQIVNTQTPDIALINQTISVTGNIVDLNQSYPSANFSEGKYLIKISAQDIAGHISTQTVQLIVDRTPPEIASMNLVSDQLFLADKPLLDYSIKLTDDYSSRFRLKIQIPAFGYSADVSSDMTESIRQTLDIISVVGAIPIPTEKSITVNFVIQDQAGNQTVSQVPITLINQLTAPLIHIRDPYVSSQKPLIVDADFNQLIQKKFNRLAVQLTLVERHATLTDGQYSYTPKMILPTPNSLTEHVTYQTDIPDTLGTPSPYYAIQTHILINGIERLTHITDLIGSANALISIVNKAPNLTQLALVKSDLQPSQNLEFTPIPSLPENALATMTVTIRDVSGNTVMTLSQPTLSPIALSKFSDGQYMADIIAESCYGFQTKTAYPFTIDSVPPQIHISDAQYLFRRADMEELVIPITVSEPNTKISHEILDAKGKSWGKQFINPGRMTDTQVIWNGKLDAVTYLPNGTYRLRITSLDKAGNIGSVDIPIDHEATLPTLFLEVGRNAVNPKKAPVQMTLKVSDTFYWATVVLKDDDTKTIQKTLMNREPKQPGTYTLILDGKNDAGQWLADGSYYFELSGQTFHNSPVVTHTVHVIIRNNAPVFNPELSRTGLRKDRSPIEIRNIDNLPDWLEMNAQIEDMNGGVIQSYFHKSLYDSWNKTEFNFAGFDHPVFDGRYQMHLWVTDDAGNRIDRTFEIEYKNDVTANAVIQMDHNWFSPNSDGNQDTLTAEVNLAGSESQYRVRIDILDELGRLIRTLEKDIQFFPGQPHIIQWDGLSDTREKMPEGTYQLAVNLTSEYNDSWTVSKPFFSVIQNPILQNLDAQLSKAPDLKRIHALSFSTASTRNACVITDNIQVSPLLQTEDTLPKTVLMEASITTTGNQMLLLKRQGFSLEDLNRSDAFTLALNADTLSAIQDQQGTHNIQITLKDGLGNTTVYESDAVILDHIAPEKPVINWVEHEYTNKNTIHSQGKGENAATVLVYRNGVLIGTSTANAKTQSIQTARIQSAENKQSSTFLDNIDITNTPLILGTNQIEWVIEDQAGNRSPTSDPMLIIYDITVPTMSVDISAVKIGLNQTVWVTVNYSEPMDTSETPVVQLQSYGVSTTSFVSAMLGSTQWLNDHQLTAGFKLSNANLDDSYQVILTPAQDLAGNKVQMLGSLESNFQSLMIDTTLPQVDAVIASPNFAKAGPVDIRIRTSEPLYQMSATLNNKPLIAKDSPDDDYWFSGSVASADIQGSANIWISAIDKTGNPVTTLNSTALVIDTISPTVNESGIFPADYPHYHNNIYVKDNQTKLNIIFSELAINTAHTQFWSSDAGVSPIWNSDQNEVQLQINRIQDGGVTVNGLVYDKALNTCDYQFLGLIFDTVPPQIISATMNVQSDTPTLDSDVLYLSDKQFIFTFSEPVTSNPSAQLTFGTPSQKIVLGPDRFERVSQADTTYQVKISEQEINALVNTANTLTVKGITDIAGNAMPAAYFTYQVDTVAPQISTLNIYADKLIYNGQIGTTVNISQLNQNELRIAAGTLRVEIFYSEAVTTPTYVLETNRGLQIQGKCLFFNGTRAVFRWDIQASDFKSDPDQNAIGVWLFHQNTKDLAGNSLNDQMENQITLDFEAPKVTDHFTNHTDNEGVGIIKPYGIQGVEDTLQFSFRLNEPAYVPQILIYQIRPNQPDTLIKTIQNYANTRTTSNISQQLETEYQFSWDGRDDHGQLVGQGKQNDFYYVKIQVYDNAGNQAVEDIDGYIKVRNMDIGIYLNTITPTPSAATKLNQAVTFQTKVHISNFSKTKADFQNEFNKTFKTFGLNAPKLADYHITIEGPLDEMGTVDAFKAAGIRYQTNAPIYANSEVTTLPIIWDGLTAQGQWAKDGYYLVEIHATDNAGNPATHNIQMAADIIEPIVLIDNTKPDLPQPAFLDVNRQISLGTAITSRNIVSIADSAYDRYTSKINLRYYAKCVPVGTSISGNDQDWTLLTNTNTADDWNPKTVSVNTSLGDQTVAYIVVDEAGNTANIATEKLIYDALPPQITLSMDNGVEVSTNLTMTVTPEDLHFNYFTINLENGSELIQSETHPTASSISWDTSALNGTYLVHIIGWDEAGNHTEVTQSILIDNIAPAFDQITVPRYSNQAANQLSIQVSDLNGPIDCFYQDGGTWHWFSQIPTQSATVSLTHTMPAETTLNIQFKIHDRLGNTRISDVYPLTFDTTLPAIAMTSDTQNWFTAAIDPIQIQVDDCAGIQNASFQWISKAGTPGFSLSDTLFVRSASAPIPDGDGIYQLRVSAKDNASNQYTRTVTYKQDTAPPSISLSPDSSWRKASFSITLTPADNSTAWGPTLNTRWDWQTYPQSRSGGTEYINPIPFNDEGVKTLYVSVWDEAGNLSQAECTYRLDTHAPICSAINDSDTLWRATWPQIVPTYAEVTPNGITPSGLISTQYRWISQTTGHTVQDWTNGISGQTVNHPAADDEYRLELTCRDAAQNSTSWQGIYLIDTTPPAVSQPVFPQSYYYGDTQINVNLTTVEKNIATLTNSYEIRRGTTILGSGTFGAVPFSINIGSQKLQKNDVISVTESCTDKAGNTNSNTNMTTVLNSIPVVSSTVISNTTMIADNNTQYTLQLTVSDQDLADDMTEITAYINQTGTQRGCFKWANNQFTQPSGYGNEYVTLLPANCSIQKSGTTIVIVFAFRISQNWGNTLTNDVSAVINDQSNATASYANLKTFTVIPQTPNLNPVSASGFGTNDPVGNISLNWTSSGSTATGYEIYRDGALVTTVTSASYVDSDRSDQHTYTYYIKAVNGSGKSSNSNSQSVSLGDYTPPATPASPQITWTDGGLNSGAQSVQITCPSPPSDVTQWQIIYANGSGTGTTGLMSPATAYVNQTVSDYQTISYGIRWYDSAGNYSNSDTASQGIPDRTAPDYSLLNYNGAGDYTVWQAAWPGNILLSGNGGVDNSGIKNRLYKWDNNAYSEINYVSGWGYNIPVPGDGNHTLWIKLIDQYNNYREQSYTYKVDTTPPTCYASDASTSWKSANMNITLTAYDGGAGLNQAKYRWDSSDVDNGTNYSNGGQISLSEGAHTLYLKAWDAMGRSSTWSGSYYLDTQAPSFSSVATNWVSFHPVIAGPISVSFTITDNNPKTYHVNVRRSSDNSIVRNLGDFSYTSGAQNTLSWDGKNDSGYYCVAGSYYFDIAATDIFNRQTSQSTSFSINYDPVLEGYAQPWNYSFIQKNGNSHWLVIPSTTGVQIRSSDDGINWSAPYMWDCGTVVDISVERYTDQVVIHATQTAYNDQIKLILPKNLESFSSKPNSLTAGVKVDLYTYNQNSTSFFKSYQNSYTLANIDLSTNFHEYTENLVGAIFRGYIRVPTSGTYRFYLNYDNGARMWLNNAILYDDLGDEVVSAGYTSSIYLEAGVTYPLMIWHVNGGGPGHITLSYSLNSGTNTVIPASWLYQDTQWSDSPSSWFDVGYSRGVTTYGYYSRSFGNVNSSRIITTVSQDWGGSGPAQCGNDDWADYRVFYFFVKEAATYTFYIDSDDDYKLTVDDMPFYNENSTIYMASGWSGNGANSYIGDTITRYLSIGLHRIFVAHGENSGSAHIYLKYRKNGSSPIDFSAGEFYTRLAADVNKGLYFAYGLPRFTIGAIDLILLSPTGNQIVETNKPTFAWQTTSANASVSTVRYKIQLKKQQAIDNAPITFPDLEWSLLDKEITHDKTNNSILSYTPNWKDTLSPGYWQWQVSEQLDSGSPIKYSASAGFEVVPKLEIEGVINYPNPFKEKTKIRYKLSKDADDVTIRIFTAAGKLVRELTGDSTATSILTEYHDVEWDGTNELNDKVLNGIYLYKIIAVSGKDRIEQSGKMIKLR